jgi:pyruvate/2-oxoglutarate dehydrogenase complex dihydrolipoamide acyltransferase (E2) component
MSTTPTLSRSPSPEGPDGAPGPRRRISWLVGLAVVAAVAGALAVGYAIGVGDSDGTPDAPAVEPADEPAADQQPDRDAPAETPADTPTADEPRTDEQPTQRPPEIRYAEEPRANWDVTGVTADDTLNVRSSPGVDGSIIATLRPDTAELESTGRIARVGDQLWREIIVPGDGAGWVNAAYLTETR